MNISLSDKESFFLKQYAEAYEAERKFDGTADPVVVVEDVEEISALPGTGDYSIYISDDHVMRTRESVKKFLLEDEGFDEETTSSIIIELDFEGDTDLCNIKKVEVIKRYRPIAYFLTRLEAEKYCQYQKHNLSNPRVYTRYCGYGNNGDMQLLNKLLLRIGNELQEAK